jgi:hypothetical protein
MTRLKRLASIALMVTVAACIGTTGAATATVKAHQAACPDFTGPAWSFPELGKTGTNWKVTARHVSCTFATRWAKKLVHTRYKGEAATKLKGPAGWTCTPSIPRGRGVPGECRSGNKLFAWGPHA